MPDSLDVILNRFLFDYRIAVHSTTGISPAEAMFGRQLKSRFNLLKPPLVKDKIIASQERNVHNSHGKRDASFSVGQQVYIRDYTNPNKPSWTQAKIKENLGSRHYGCVITHNGREIKRHLNQIREAHEAIVDQSVEMESNRTAIEEENQRAQEHASIRRNNPDIIDVRVREMIFQLMKLFIQCIHRRAQIQKRTTQWSRYSIRHPRRVRSE